MQLCRIVHPLERLSSCSAAERAGCASFTASRERMRVHRGSLSLWLSSSARAKQPSASFSSCDARRTPPRGVGALHRPFVLISRRPPPRPSLPRDLVRCRRALQHSGCPTPVTPRREQPSPQPFPPSSPAFQQPRPSPTRPSSRTAARTARRTGSLRRQLDTLCWTTSGSRCASFLCSLSSPPSDGSLTRALSLLACPTARRRCTPRRRGHAHGARGVPSTCRRRSLGELFLLFLLAFPKPQPSQQPSLSSYLADPPPSNLLHPACSSSSRPSSRTSSSPSSRPPTPSPTRSRRPGPSPTRCAPTRRSGPASSRPTSPLCTNSAGAPS